MEEEWGKVETYNIPEGRFVVTKFVQNSEGTKIVLDDERTVVEVFFDGVPILARIAVENIRMRTWSEVQLKYKDKYMFKNTFFFEIKNSLLVKWAVEEGCGFYDENEIRHYCIITGQEIIDLLVTFDPVVKIVSPCKE